MKIAFVPAPAAAKRFRLLSVAALSMAAAHPVLAQYPPDAQPAAADNTQGPVRLVRFSIIDGNVTWRPDGNSQWQGAETNLPLNQGAQVWSDPTSRSEIQFDDGTLLRLGPNALVTLTSLYSDAQGEYTQIQETSGLVTIEPTNDHSIYELDTPQAQIKVAGPARVRVGVGAVTDVAARAGAAQVQGAGGQVTVEPGQYLVVPDGAVGYQVQGIPYADLWDQWNDQRDQEIVLANAQVPQGALPPDIGLAAPGLSDYGDWQYAQPYGYVWRPHVYRGWRPYYAGHWVSVAPFGWTWVSAEPWGWAPYHYGSWVDTPGGWAWVPGPADQYWSPAVVHFTYYGGNVAWCPLAPEEVRYPSVFRVGVYGNSWSLFFSVGGCAIYLNDGYGVCQARPWDFGYLHAHRWDPVFRGFGAGFGPGHFVDHAFVPRNQRFGGAIVTDAGHFQFAGAYRTGGPEAATLFSRGRSASFVSGFGPATVRPVAFRVTGARLGGAPPRALIQRHAFGTGSFGTGSFGTGSFGAGLAGAPRSNIGTVGPALHGTSSTGSFGGPGAFARTGTTETGHIGGITSTAPARSFSSGIESPAESAAAARRSLGFTSPESSGSPVRTDSGLSSSTFHAGSTGGGSVYHLPQAITPTYNRPSSLDSGVGAGFADSSTYHAASPVTPAYSRPTTSFSSASGTSSFGGRSSGTTTTSSSSHSGSSYSAAPSHHETSSGFKPFSNGGPNHGH